MRQLALENERVPPGLAGWQAGWGRSPRSGPQGLRLPSREVGCIKAVEARRAQHIQRFSTSPSRLKLLVHSSSNKQASQPLLPGLAFATPLSPLLTGLRTAWELLDEEESKSLRCWLDRGRGEGGGITIREVRRVQIRGAGNSSSHGRGFLINRYPQARLNSEMVRPHRDAVALSTGAALVRSFCISRECRQDAQDCTVLIALIRPPGVPPRNY